MPSATRELEILTAIENGGFSSQRGKNETFESDAAIVQSFHDRDFITAPYRHRESQTGGRQIDLISVTNLTDTGRAYLESLKRG